MEQAARKQDTVDVVCPKCRARGILPAHKLSKALVNLRCPRCGERFPFFQEKRGFFRKKVEQITARYGDAGLDYDRLMEQADILDLSMIGIRLKMKHPPLQPILRLMFILPPRNEPVKATAEVVWTLPCTEGGIVVGMKFAQMDPYSKKLLGFFLMP